jgi:hypothetical protein
LREAIIATLETLAKGKITDKELPVLRNDTTIRYAPGFGKEMAPALPNKHPYTVDGLAKFLGGEAIDDTGHASHTFKATFGMLELVDGKGLKEADIAGLEVWKIDAVVTLRNRTQWGRKAPPCNRWPMCQGIPDPNTGTGVSALHTLQRGRTGV